MSMVDPSIDYLAAVSYTHLDVYKRQNRYFAAYRIARSLYRDYQATGQMR